VTHSESVKSNFFFPGRISKVEESSVVAARFVMVRVVVLHVPAMLGVLGVFFEAGFSGRGVDRLGILRLICSLIGESVCFLIALQSAVAGHPLERDVGGLGQITGKSPGVVRSRVPGGVLDVFELLEG